MEWESFVPDDEAWALALMVFLGDPPGRFVQMFEVVACSKEWLGSAGWKEPGGFWFNMHGRAYTVPWPCLVIEHYSPESLRSAVEDIVDRCYTRAQDLESWRPQGIRPGGLQEWFMHSISPFVHWDGDAVP